MIGDIEAIFVAVVVFFGLAYACLSLVLSVVEPILELLQGDSSRIR